MTGRSRRKGCARRCGRPTRSSATVTDKVTADVLAVEPRRAGLVANFGVGFNNIDIEAAKVRGVAVSNTPDVLTDATADLAMTLLLMVARRTGEGERHLRGWPVDRVAADAHARHPRDRQDARDWSAWGASRARWRNAPTTASA